MKKLLTFFLVLLGFAAQGQENSKNSFGLNVGTGKTIVLRASQEGAQNLDLEKNFEIGANYYRQIGTKLKLETGLFYHYNQLNQWPALAPDNPAITTQYDVHLMYLPLFLRYNLSEYFFINGGGLIDIDLSNPMGLSTSRALDSQSGLGVGIGIGGELALFPGYLLQINPYLNLHGALQLQQENYPGQILDAGIKIGLRTE